MTPTIKDPMRVAQLIAGRIPNDSEIIGLYEASNGAKLAMVKLKNGQEVAYSCGVMRRINPYRTTRSGITFFETTTVTVQHIPAAVNTLAHGPDPELIR
jgi:hypothetical protein